MNSAVSRLGAWLWYLVPANPILVRVVCGMSRRTRHLWMRFGYLAILLTVVTVTLLATGTTTGASLGVGGAASIRCSAETSVVVP